MVRTAGAVAARPASGGGTRDILAPYLAGSAVFHQGPYLRLALAEFVDVGISEHTERVCLMVQGLGTVIYHVPDLDRAKAWYSTAFQTQPYFDQPFYVGFNIAGFELGLDPDETANKAGRGGTVAYWRVNDIDSAVEHFAGTGATILVAVQNVGGDIKVATVTDPFGNPIGLIENPHFAVPKK